MKQKIGEFPYTFIFFNLLNYLLILLYLMSTYFCHSFLSSSLLFLSYRLLLYTRMGTSTMVHFMKEVELEQGV